MRTAIFRPMRILPGTDPLPVAVLCLISIFWGATGCRAPEPIFVKEGKKADFEAAWGEGRNRWRKSQQGEDETYFYWRNRQSMSGIIQMTGVQIVEGRPAARYYKMLKRGSAGVSVVRAWREEGVRIGQERAGFPALSMTDLYEACRRKNLPVDLTTHRLQLKIGPRGVLLACFAAHRRCMDDCGENFGVNGILYGRLSAADGKKFLTFPGTRWE